VSKIKKIFFIFVFSCFVSNSFAISDALIGTIGNKALLKTDLVNEMKMLLIISGKNFSEKDKNELQAAALQSITKTLIKQIAIEKNNFNNFNKDDVNRELKKITENLNINLKELKKLFENNNVDFSHLLNRIETELKWNGLIFSLYKNRINVNLDLINEQLESIQKRSFINEYLLYEIVSESVSKDKIKSKINEIKNEIKNNGFEKAAIKYSKSETALNGGSLGWIKETMLVESFRNILQNTEVGSVTEPMLLNEGIMFLKLANKRKIKSELNVEKLKKALLNAEKDKKLKVYSVSHYNKLKQSIPIEYKFQ